jgi:Tat protein secretion system quality control protein TatD with DNase activity
MRKVFVKVLREKVGSEQLSVSSLFESGFVIETDAPFLVPRGFKPNRTNRNEPEAVKVVFEFIGDLVSRKS